jgi:PTH2 family peptidyl-tRNA hydrolase
MVSEVKMIIVVRKDLDLGKGKMAAQVAHAAVSLALHSMKNDKRTFRQWLDQGQKKVVVRVDDLKGLYEIKEKFEAAGINTSLITDAGLTQIPPGTVTCLGAGPAESEQLDAITGSLSLY